MYGNELSGGDIVLIVFVACGLVVSIFAIVAWTFVSLINGRRRGTTVNEEESRLIQEIYHGLGKMEQRVESLETLLLEREKRG